MPPGQIEWLGGHPLQESLLVKMANLYPPSGVLSEQDAIEQPSTTSRGTVDQLLQDCLAGNERFLRSDAQFACDWTPEKLESLELAGSGPKALVLAGSHRHVRAAERLLNASPGEFLVHRTFGAIGGRSQDCSIRYLENLLAIGGRSQDCSIRYLENLLDKHPSIPLLLVLGDVCDPAVSRAITQVQSKAKVLKHPNAQMALEQITPAAVHALGALGEESAFKGAQQQLELTELTTELHIRYVLERLLIDADLVIDRVATGRLEVQGAIVQADGRLRMLGGPDVHRLIGQKARVERHRRKGFGLGRARTKGRQFVYSPR